MKYLPLLLLLLLFGCATTKKLQWDDLNQLSGTWQIACSGPIGQPDALECPEVQGHQLIELDTKTGKGRFVFDLGVQTIRQDFTISKESDKLILFYVDPQGNTSRGEIVKLDKQTLEVHYLKEGIMTVQARSK